MGKAHSQKYLCDPKDESKQNGEEKYPSNGGFCDN